MPTSSLLFGPLQKENWKKGSFLIFPLKPLFQVRVSFGETILRKSWKNILLEVISIKKIKSPLSGITCGIQRKSLLIALATELRGLAPDTVVKVFNLALTDKNEVMSEVFKSKAIPVGSSTVSNDILWWVDGSVS